MPTITNNTTTNYHIPLPSVTNRLADDIPRLINAISTIDSLLLSKLDVSSGGIVGGAATLDGNGRLNLTQLPALTGDITSTAGTNVLALSTTGVTPGTYSQVTVDAKGRVTAASNSGTVNTSKAIAMSMVFGF